jgi:hypothetical protein
MRNLLNGLIQNTLLTSPFRPPDLRRVSFILPDVQSGGFFCYPESYPSGHLLATLQHVPQTSELCLLYVLILSCCKSSLSGLDAC